MNDIRIDLGVYTSLSVDLSNYDFNGIEKVILTVKNKPDVNLPAIIEREFTESKLYNVVFTPEESLQVKMGAVYDFTKVLVDGTRHKEGDNGKVILRAAVGDCIE